MADAPARIHVLLARDAPYAVVIRRGPSKHVATIGWDRETDSFTPGQWLKGRIYERRSDLSSDGKFLLYFAMNGKWESETKGSWTAISQAPYLKAIGLWAKGDCWHGGGLFTGADRFWINEGYGHQPLHVPPRLIRDQSHPPGGVGGECLGVYFPRLIRDGWHLVSDEVEQSNTTSFWQFEKPAFRGWTLRKRATAALDHPPGKGCYYDEHELINEVDGVRVDGSTWDWADVDRHRLVWSESGKLFEARLEPAGLAGIRELFDFNPMTFEAIEAPY
ncbi:MAG: hypothetical protein WD468_12560 [Pirellulales bacterium]